MGKQILAVSLLNFKSLPGRFWPSLVIVVGMTCVIAVLLSMLSLTTGYVQSEMKAGDPGRAIILADGSEEEPQSSLTRDQVNIIMDAPGIRKDADGAPLAEAEIALYKRADRKTGIMSYMLLRGFGAKGLALRPELKLIAGRMFRPGSRDVIVGRATQGQIAGMEIGDKITLPSGQWPIVGVFSTGGDTLEGQLIADRDTLMAAERRTAFNSVLARLDNAPDAMDTLKTALARNSALSSVIAERHSTYYEHLSGPNALVFRFVTYATGAIMALGAMFGALNILYAGVSARTQEIGTLRTLGFGALPVAVSVVSECLLLALTGALIGAGLARLAFDGAQKNYFSNMFDLRVTPGLIGLGLAWALAIALLGSLAPAIRAARLPIVAALRAT